VQQQESLKDIMEVKKHDRFEKIETVISLAFFSFFCFSFFLFFFAGSSSFLLEVASNEKQRRFSGSMVPSPKFTAWCEKPTLTLHSMDKGRKIVCKCLSLVKLIQ